MSRDDEILAVMGDGVKSASDKLNYYAYSTIKAPDKGEVGGSSPPRPTTQITSKYAAILVFPLPGDSLTKPICQPFVNFTIGRMAVHSGALRPFG